MFKGVRRSTLFLYNRTEPEPAAVEVTNTHVLGKLPGNGPTMSFIESGKKNRSVAANVVWSENAFNVWCIYYRKSRVQ